MKMELCLLDGKPLMMHNIILMVLVKKLTSCWIGNSYILSNGKTVDGKKKYYSNKTHSFVTNQLIQIDGSYYYFDSEGSVATGFTTIDQNTYYFNASGKMATGWIQIDGTYYFFLMHLVL